MEQTVAQQGVCPLWFYPDKAGCSCSDFHAIICGSDFPLLHLGYCMTYNESTETTEFGPCPYITQYNNITKVEDVFYIQLPGNASLLMSLCVDH